MFWNAAPLAVNAVLLQIYQHADKLMTTGLIGERSTGYLAPAFTIHFGVVELINSTVLIALFPLMSRYYGDGKQPIFGTMVEKLTRFMLIISLPVALCLSIFADVVIGMIYRPVYAPSGGILRVLIWYSLLNMTGNVLVQAMQVQNRQRWVVIIRAAGLVVNIALNAVLLVQFRDPRGAALASVIAESLVITLLLAQFRAAGWRLPQALPGLLRVAFIGLIAGIVMLIAGSVHFVAGITAGLAVYAAGIVYGKALAGDDWELLYRLVGAMPGGGRLQRVWKRNSEA
jgi:O-antigen/teichoic acid export membrane protein